MPNDSESTNPFVHFKHFVDDQISQTVRRIWSLPSSSSSPSSSSNMAVQDHQGNTIPIFTNTNDRRPFVVLGKVPDEGIPPEVRKLGKDIEAGRFQEDPLDREVEALESAVWRGLRDQAIHSWVRYSAYSPVRLQDTLPQPVPKDVPASSYPPKSNRETPREQYRFTFRDAFEDLLAVSSGQPLKPVAELESRLTTPRRPPGSLFSELSSATSWRDWTANMERRYLWDAYFPTEQFDHAAHRIATIATGDLFRRELTADQAEGYIHKLVRDAAACEEERRWRRNQLFWPRDRGAGSAAPWTLGTPFDRHGRDVGAGGAEPAGFEQHPLARLLGVGGVREMPGDREEEARRRMDAETEEDLYRNVESDYARSRRPRRLDMSQPREDEQTPSSAVARRSPQGAESGGVTKSDSGNNKNEEWTEEFPEPDGGKTVKSVARKVGPWMSHETVTTTRYDADGNVVQRMSQRQHSASKEFRWSSSGSGDDDEKTDNEGKEPSSGKGWFWTK